MECQLELHSTKTKGYNVTARIKGQRKRKKSLVSLIFLDTHSKQYTLSAGMENSDTTLIASVSEASSKRFQEIKVKDGTTQEYWM